MANELEIDDQDKVRFYMEEIPFLAKYARAEEVEKVRVVRMSPGIVDGLKPKIDPEIDDITPDEEIVLDAQGNELVRLWTNYEYPMTVFQRVFGTGPEPRNHDNLRSALEYLLQEALLNRVSYVLEIYGNTLILHKAPTGQPFGAWVAESDRIRAEETRRIVRAEIEAVDKDPEPSQQD